MAGPAMAGGVDSKRPPIPAFIPVMAVPQPFAYGPSAATSDSPATWQTPKLSFNGASDATINAIHG
eukprot:scaffold174408_cov19-Prasinocladus_malaysianus.AAC.1